eukprot:s915_g10.t1
MIWYLKGRCDVSIAASVAVFCVGAPLCRIANLFQRCRYATPQEPPVRVPKAKSQPKVEEVAEPEPKEEKEEEPEEMQLEPGDLVDGVVTTINNKGVWVNIGGGKKGLLEVPAELKGEFRRGDSVQGMRVEEVKEDGNPVLSMDDPELEVEEPSRRTRNKPKGKAKGKRTPVAPEHALPVMCPAQGGAGLRPVLARREYRLPLLVKYHKPKGMVTSMRVQKNIKKTDLEDLRSVVSFAGDEFELDLYHPVGGLATGASGLFLWSRSGRLTRQLQDPRRGVANILELEVCGAVRAEYLDEALQTGVNLGVTGFQRTYTASVLEAALLPDSSLQEPRSRVTILARDGRAQVPAMVERCSPEADTGAHLGDALLSAFRKNHCRLAAYLLVILRPSFSDDAVRASQILEAVGKLEAATTDEEVWACELAGLPASEPTSLESFVLHVCTVSAFCGAAPRLEPAVTKHAERYYRSTAVGAFISDPPHVDAGGLTYP